jgi:hypothetical protein
VQKIHSKPKKLISQALLKMVKESFYMKGFDSKIQASIVTYAICGLHNYKYAKYSHQQNCVIRASIESSKNGEIFGISKRKVIFCEAADKSSKS